MIHVNDQEDRCRYRERTEAQHDQDSHIPGGQKPEGPEKKCQPRDKNGKEWPRQPSSDGLRQKPMGLRDIAADLQGACLQELLGVRFRIEIA